MDSGNRWCVAEWLAADCERAWLHPEKEEKMQNSIVGRKMKKVGGKRKMEYLHQQG